MYREVDYGFYTEKFLKQLPKGVFLSTRNGSISNTMTIGWGNIGIMWGRPIFIASIMPSCFTCELIEKTSEFTISIPVDEDFSDELALCGQLTGRNDDKFLECDLTAMNSKTLEACVVSDCKLHLDCKVLMKHEIKIESLPERIKKEYYKRGNFHNLYYSEIISAYVNE